jgi:hypothetical protein
MPGYSYVGSSFAVFTFSQQIAKSQQSITHVVELQLYFSCNMFRPVRPSSCILVMQRRQEVPKKRKLAKQNMQ